MSDVPYRFERTVSAAEVAERLVGPGRRRGVGRRGGGGWPADAARAPRASWPSPSCATRRGRCSCSPSTKVTADFAAFTRLNLGDWIGAKGEVVRTKRGELSVKVAEWALLAEARRSFGDKWRGRDRRRDPLPPARGRPVGQRAQPRGRCCCAAGWCGACASGCGPQGFVEVETPILHPIPGGAHARPFVTDHNALDTDFYLRIAPELYLKRLVVGGFEKVFEIGRLFRNEGISPRHNPEFTMLELYEAYADYRDLMVLVEELVAGLATDLLGTYRAHLPGPPARPHAALAAGDHGRARRRSARPGRRRRTPPRDELAPAALGRRGRAGPGVGPGQALAGALREDHRVRHCGARSSSATTRPRSPRWPGATATTPSWSSASRPSWPGASS